MVDKITNLDDLMAKIRPFLRRYLEERNIDIDGSGGFLCIHPDHNDRRLGNCSFIKGTKEQKFFCFSCGAGSDIFDAANFLESKPLSGEGFIEGNVLYLANKYGIDYDTIEATPEEMYTRRVHSAYSVAADIISEYQPLEYISSRKWPVTLCRELKIGTVRSHSEFLSRMEHRGFDAKFVGDIDLNRSIFNERMLIFSISDEKGRVVGFSGRDMSHDKTSKKLKFINTSSKCPIYNKSNILYGLNVALKNPTPLYIFEGYPDFVTAYKYGMTNICAIGGTALTRDHIRLLRGLGISDCILALDGDEPGQLRTQKLLDDYFRGDETIRIRVLKLPNDNSDPDDYINAYGVDNFNKLSLLTPFQWRLSRFDYESKPEDVCDKLIPLILNDPNEIHRELMARELSESTGIRLKTIVRQIDKLINIEDARKDNQIQLRLKQVADDIKYTPDNPTYILEAAADDIRQLQSLAGEDIHASNEVLSSIDIIKDEFSSRKPGLQGWKTGFENLDTVLSGIPKQDTMITFAGDSNTGKCKKFDTPVLLSDGTYKTIEYICKNKLTNIMTMDNHRIVKSKASDWVDSGKLRCYKVKTASGLVDESSETHPYYTINGWKMVKDLTVGDKIAVPKRYDIEGVDSISKEESLLLGLFLSDGSITKAAGFSNTDKELLGLFKSLVRKVFNGIPSFRYDKNTLYASYSGQKVNPALDFLRQYGLLGRNSHNKFVPDEIFSGTNDIISSFIGAFYACDGWFYNNGKRVELGLSLCNYNLIKQIHSLLLRLGIKTKISSGKVKLNGKCFDRFTISIGDYNNILKFNQKINLPLKYKSNAIKKYLNKNKCYDNKRYSYKNYFPKELWSVIKDKCSDKKIPMNMLLDNVCNDTEYYDKSRNKKRTKKYNVSFNNNINPNLLKKIAEYLDDNFLESICDGDISFDEITDVQGIGIHQCYDLVVNRTNNFIANDIVVHNTGFMLSLALNLSKHNDNIMTLFMSIDDSRQQAMTRLVAIESGLKIKQITHPSQNISNDEDRKKLVQGWDAVRRLVEQNKFSLKDNSHGNTLDFAEGWIRWAKDNYPNKEIVFFLDNFHKLGDERQKDERIRFKHASARIHSMKNKLHFTAICTMEIRKLMGGAKNQRPMLQDISESKQMEYDNNLIGMIYNDLHASRDKASTIWTDTVGGEPVRRPVLEIDIQKNKISEYKDILYYKFVPERSIFFECGEDEIREWKKDYSAAIKQVQDKRHPEAGGNPFLKV